MTASKKSWLPWTGPDHPNKEESRSYIFAVGEVDGDILSMYYNIFQKEQELDVTCDWIISPGSFGVWPDEKFIDKATRRKSGPGDFFKLYSEQWVAPRQTLFVEGAHEDHVWLARRYSRKDTQVLGNVYNLVNGYKTVIGPRVVGLGKVFSPKAYNGTPRFGSKYYTKNEVEKACTAGPCDILLTHQGPLNELFGRKKSISEGIKSTLFATRPKVLIHSGYNYSKQYECMNTICFSLAKMEILPMMFHHDTGDLVFLE